MSALKMVDVHEIWVCDASGRPTGAKPIRRFTDERTAKVKMAVYEREGDPVVMITKYGIVNPEKEMADGYASVYILEKAHVSVKVNTTKTNALEMWLASHMPSGVPLDTLDDVADLVRKAVMAAKKGEI